MKRSNLIDSITDTIVTRFGGFEMELIKNITEDDIISAFTSNYRSTYIVDLDTDEVYGIKIGEKIEDELKNAFKGSVTYTDHVEAYVNTIVAPEYRRSFISEMNLLNIQRRLKNKDSYTYDFLGLKDGERKYFRMHIYKIKAEGNLAVFGIEDVDLEIRQQNEAMAQLEVAVRNALDADRIKNDFLSNMSHELLTPLNAIIGFKEIAALNIDSPEELTEALSYIGSAVRQMTYLVNNILNMGELLNGTVDLNEEVCNLKDLVKDIETVILAEAKEKEISFNVDISEAGDENICVDKPLFNRVLMNILGNAVKYTNKRGRVDFTISQHKTGSIVAVYEIRVKDNGIGMSEEYKIHLFEMFTRASSTTDSGIFGCGLGMAVTKRILDMMNGSIEVKSELNEGTEVIMNIPLRMA